MQLVLTITADTAHELKQAITGIYENSQPKAEASAVRLHEKKEKTIVKTEPGKNDPPVATSEQQAEIQKTFIPDDTKHITLEEIRELMQKVSQAGKRTEAKGLLDKYEAKSLTALYASDYADLKDRLEKL